MTTYLYTATGHHSCSACNMSFSNTTLLAKHRARFCIGDGTDILLIKTCRKCESRRCHCDDESPERSKYNPNSDPKLHTLAENHGKQMEFLSNRNRDLERQRDEIRRRLGDLGRKPPEGDNTAALLAELRDQEARNQRLLDELKKQLLASRQPVAIIGEQQIPQKKSFTYPVYYGNSLVAEISAIRQAYIQSGGNDPEILAQLAQMIAEAQAIEDAMRNKKPPEPKKKEKKTEITSHVMTLDLENERLNRELMLLQEQNTMAKNRRKGDREGRLPTLRFGTMSSRLGLSNYGSLGYNSRYSSLRNTSNINPLLYGSSSYGYNPLYKSLLDHSNSTDETNLGLLNSLTGRVSALGRPGTGLGYRSYRPGLSHRSSVLGDGGLSLIDKYGLNPSIRDSLELRNSGLVDIGTSPISSSRLSRPFTTLGLHHSVDRIEPHRRQPYPLGSVAHSPVPYHKSYLASRSVSQMEKDLRDDFENSENRNNDHDDDNETHPTVPKLKLDVDESQDDVSEEQPNSDVKKATTPEPPPKKKGFFSSRKTKPPLKSALKQSSKTVEPSSPSDLNNHPTNTKTFDKSQVYDSDVIYNPTPDTVQYPGPRKPTKPNSFRPISTAATTQPVPKISYTYSLPSTSPYLSVLPVTNNVSATPVHPQPSTTSVNAPLHPDTYRTPPDTSNSRNSNESTSNTPYRPRPVRRPKPGVSPIPEESYSDRQVGDGVTSPVSTRIVHSYSKPSTDPSDPYNYYAETGWPPSDDTMHKDHKGYHPLNPEKRNTPQRSRGQDVDKQEENKMSEADIKKQAKAQEAARKKAESEAKKKTAAEEKARKASEAEAKKQAKLDQDARNKAEAEAKKQADNARKKAEAEAKKQNKNNKNTPKNQNQNEPSQKPPKNQNQNVTADQPENSYRFKDNFVGRNKNPDPKKAVSFNE